MENENFNASGPSDNLTAPYGQGQNYKPQTADGADSNAQLQTDILANLRSLEYDVALRNIYMNKRDRYLYGRGLYETLNFPDGFDQTTYNFLPRVVDIHTAQLMGRGFSTFSTYQKEDISVYESNDPQIKTTLMVNKIRQHAADSRQKMVAAMIKDNGGFGTFKSAARLGSAYGNTVFKMWWNPKEQKIEWRNLESPFNYRAGWRDSDFRKTDWDGYVYEISEDRAYAEWGDKLPVDTVFQVTQEGFPLSQPIGNMNTSDPLDQNTASAYPIQTQRPMVAAIDFTGILKGWGVSDSGDIVRVDRGKEKRFSVLIVGGVPVEKITDPDLMPNYYLIRNREIPRRAWGESDLTDSALEINATYLERMSDFITVANKTLFPMIQAKGFESTNIPKKQQRKMAVVPMDPSQALEVVDMPTSFGEEYTAILSELKDDFVHITGIGRVLFDDPTIDTNSNPAVTTMMKGVIDIVEDKQSRWEPKLVEMFTDALNLTAKHVPDAKKFIDTDDSWDLYIKWPNVLRKEDPTFQAMLLTDMHAGVISPDTYLEERGVQDVTEEIAKIRDAMKDPTRAAIMGSRLSELAQFTIFDSLGVPLWGFNVPKISLTGDLTPQQEGNMGDLYGWDSGPYGASIGPQGLGGKRTTENVINSGFVQYPPGPNGQPGIDPYAKYGTPTGMTPGQPITQQQGAPGGQPPQYGTQQAGQQPQQAPQAPQPGQMPQGGGQQPQIVPQVGSAGPQPVSQAGSGATPVTPQGKVAQTKQRRGR
jgi:hypothetical protein